MTGQVAVFALAIAGYCAGWYARGGSDRRRAAPAPAPAVLPAEAREALVAAVEAGRTALASPTGSALAKLRAAMDRAEAVDIALEQHLGAEDPRYRRFERMLNVLVSVSHQASSAIAGDLRRQELIAGITGVATELDAPAR